MMIVKTIPVTIVLITLFHSTPVFSAPLATPMSASHLLAACKESDSNEYARGFCDGAIDALYSSIQDWCVPASVTHGEVSDHIKRQLLNSSHPLSIGAFEFVNRSVQKAWPCR
jgi:hypothetical protein